MSTKKLQIIGSFGGANAEHTHDASDLQLYDTVSAYGVLEVNNVSPSQHALDIILSSETYSDFSNVTVNLVSDHSSHSAVATANGTVTGLYSETNFTLSLQTDYNAEDILITCTYQLDLDKVLHDYILHVDLDGESGDGGSDGFGSGSVILDTSLSVAGAAADAAAVGAAIDELESTMGSKVDKVEGMGLSSNDFTDEYKDQLDNLVDIGGSFVNVDEELTTSGAAADAKVTGDKIKALEDLVGTDSVSDQITEAINNIDLPSSSVESVNGKTGVVKLTASDVGALPDDTEIPSVDGLASEQFVTDKIEEAIVEVYVQDEAPTDAPEGSIWVDTANDGLCNSAIVPNIHVKHITGDSDISSVDFSEFAIGDIVLVTQS